MSIFVANPQNLKLQYQPKMSECNLNSYFFLEAQASFHFVFSQITKRVKTPPVE
jgi:hypothetical protein